MMGGDAVIGIIFLKSLLLFLPLVLNMNTFVENVVLSIHDDRGSNHDMPQWLDADIFGAIFLKDQDEVLGDLKGQKSMGIICEKSQYGGNTSRHKLQLTKK
mmetsp:Transcript_1319/g.2464  ORF Transcript_1319/g.2464 Transcript_1319/m.2464 type:complete len:101 (-) Transcript_1319:380-682(-)